jgi:dienelactone hydrolase
MSEVLLFHHALGQTEGFHAFADELGRAGHTVHTPDLFEGRSFGSIEEGVGYAQEVGFGKIIARGERAAEELPAELVYAGFSLGVVPAQKLAQTRPGARGALFFYSCLPVSEFGEWPADLPAQIHGMDADPIFMEEGDVDAARELVEAAADAELFLYPGSEHYFADSSLPSYDAEATALLTERVLEFLRAADVRTRPAAATPQGLAPGAQPRRDARLRRGPSPSSRACCGRARRSRSSGGQGGRAGGPGPRHRGHGAA